MREAPKCGCIYYCSRSILVSLHWLAKHAVESENAEHMEKVEERQHLSHVSHAKTLDGTGKICSGSCHELALLAYTMFRAQYVHTCGRLFPPVFPSWASEFREVASTPAGSQRKWIFKVLYVQKVFPTLPSAGVSYHWNITERSYGVTYVSHCVLR